MAQRTDITRIDFQANARGANAAIESIRVKAEECNTKVTKLKEELKTGINANLPADQIERMRQNLASARKEANQFSTAYKELVKGMRTLDQGIKAFNDGSLSQMSAAFQKAVNNAAKLTISRLNPMSETYKKDKEQLIALKDASQQYYARLQADSAMVIKTIQQGGKVSRQAINEELTAHRELLSVLSEDDAGYKRTAQNIAILEQHQRAMGGNYAYIRQNMSDTRKVSDQTLASMLAELQKVNQEGRVSQKVLRENATMMREIRAEQGRRVQSVLGGDLTKQSEGSIRQAIATAKELLATYKTGSKEAQALSAQIVNAEEHLKTHGVEGERAARKQAEAVRLLDEKYKMMQDRMRNLGSLSQGALTETQRFWQAQMDGALKGSKAYKEAAANLKLIAQEQQRVATAQLQQQAARIAPTKVGQYRLGALSEQELQTSIAAAKQLASAMKTTDPAYKQLIDNIVRAEQHLKQFGLEGQRSTRQAAEQLQQMTQRMGQLKSLSAAGLEETRKYWQAQMDGAQRGSAAYKQAEANVRALTAEQQRLTTEQNKAAASQLMKRGSLTTMSEGAIRQAITAAREYQQTLSTSDPIYKRLTKSIVDAEEHIKKFGVEAERAARKEIEAAKKAADERKKADQLMANQLRNSKTLSESALKAQQQYWQRLIDDPKTASGSLKQYEANLKQVKQLQEQMVTTKGQAALTFFRGDTSNASASQIQQQADALKKYRDSLPQKTHATLIAEINGYLEKAGQSAQNAADKAMSMKQALQVSAQAGSGSFRGTTEQLNQAKKVLEDMSARAQKGGYAWRRIQEAIQRINLELKNTGHISREVDAILNNPKGRSFNELKQAVEQGRAALNAMRTTTKEGQKAFDELAKKVKEADFQMKQLQGTSKGAQSSFEKAWGRFKTYVSFYVGAAAAIRKVTGTIADVASLSDKLGEVRKTTGFTADEVGRLSDNLKKLDTRTGIIGLMELASVAGTLGLKTQEDVEGFVEAANKLMVALPEMGKDGAKEMLKVALATGEIDKINRQMQQGLVEGSSATAVAMEKIGSTIDQLRANSAAAAPQITDFVKRVGAVGAQSGISIDQVAALGATVDALGLRVEMSATALSRMIPAIRNNAFSIAKSIGITPETLRDLFDTGRGMEAILMIFERIRDTGKDVNSIEDMLGMAGMKDIMKELNQMGARAGIVFAGLSQNVDELRRNLGIASKAYEENMAIQREYDKMNETTAAKWERLKNQVEEMFVGDNSQRWLGGIIDGMRDIVDLLTDNVTPAWQTLGAIVKSILVYWTVKSLGILGIFPAMLKGLRNMGVALGVIRGQLSAMDKANIFTAIASAVAYLAYRVFDAVRTMNELRRELVRIDIKEYEAVRSVNQLTTAFNNSSAKAEEAAKKKEQLEKQTKSLREEVDRLRASNDQNGAASDKLKQKEDELKKSKEALKKATDESNKANSERLNLIKQINDKYNTYLGYMLNEKTAAEQVASAHQLIIAALKEEMEQKRLNKEVELIDDRRGKEIEKYQTESYNEMSTLTGDYFSEIGKQRIIDDFNSMLASVQYSIRKDQKGNIIGQNFSLGATPGLIAKGTQTDNINEVLDVIKEGLRNAINKEYGGKANARLVENTLNDIWGGGLDNGFRNWAQSSLLREREVEQARSNAESRKQGKHNITVREAATDIRSQQSAIDATLKKQGELTDDDLRMLGQYANAITANITRFGDELNNVLDLEGKQIGVATDKYLDKEGEVTIQNTVNTLYANLTEQQRKAILKAAKKGQKSTTGTGSVDVTTTNVWGEQPEAASTDWKNMSAEVLVERRKQMNEFVKAIQTDTDVQAVLKEDAALKKAIENGMASDMRTVINWYNTERLKIQDELHARFLTNTGDWMDPKKQKAAHKQFKAELDAYLEELDAYYTERKTEIETARSQEEITEGEAWRRNLRNENEWYQRRAELMMLYGKDAAEVTAKEQEAIVRIIAERTGESEEFVRAMIKKTIGFAKQIEQSGEKGAAMVHDWMAKLDLDTQRSFLKSQQAITKQMKFIEDTLAKERPYDGITKNLQDNLDKMGVLAAQMRRVNDELTRQDKQPKYSDAEITAQSYKEMAFYLNQAADAYSIDINELLRRMTQEGMAETAKEIEKSDLLKQAVMGQLRKTYQEVQDAIKKEASQIKKDVEILWNDDTLGPDGRSIKATFDKASAALGMQQDSVARANSLIGAGAASDNVASRLAMKQIEVQMRMQKAQFDMFRNQAHQRMAALRAEAKEHERLAALARQQGDIAEAERETLAKTNAMRDAENVRRSLGLTLAEETKKEEEQKAELLKLQEESQNRLYTSLREWADLLTSSLQQVMEAEHAGDAEYYNERAKLDLTGKGGPGAGTYVVIDNAGTSDAQAHYEYLDERQALERQHEIEIENARAEAWKKVWDDLNMKMSDQITDWVNAQLQDAATKDNTSALIANTEAIYKSMGVETGEPKPGQPDVMPTAPKPDKPSAPVAPIVIPSGSTSEIPTPASAGTDDANTAATNANTAALNTLTQLIGGQSVAGTTDAGGTMTTTVEGDMTLQKPFFQMTEDETAAAMEMIGRMWQTYNEGGVEALQAMAETLAAMEGIVLPPWQITEEGLATAMERMGQLWQSYAEQGIAAMQQMSDAMAEMPNQIPNPAQITEEQAETSIENAANMYQGLAQVQIDANKQVTDKSVENKQKEVQSAVEGDKKKKTSTQSTYAAMAQAMNMYGTAYQIMSNENMDMTQKFQMFALQAAGQTAIGMLTTNMLATDAQGKVELPGILGKAASQLGPVAGPIAFAAMTALLGGLMAVAMSSVTKSKSQIAQVTGASASAGRLSTGMLTYASGNVNEFSDPASLTPGRTYNVDAADGRTYRAKYTGANPSTHITNGPEFHLVGERGREAIIDAHTTRLLQMDETGIWQSIQTLYNGGSLSALRRSRNARRGRGMAAFADGNLDDFGFDTESTEMMEGAESGGMNLEMVAAMQSSLERNNELLERALTEGLKAVNVWHGPEGIPNMVNKYNKEATRHGVKYL